MVFGKSFQLILQLGLVTGALYCELTMVTASSVSETTAHNLFANHRPRFKIPKGNLSYYRRPHWEILYFMKYGTFPFKATSSTYLNRTQFINKMRAIKSLFDRQTTEEESGEDNVANNLNVDEQNETSRLTLVTPFSQENLRSNQVGNGNYVNRMLGQQELEDNIRSIKRLSSKKNVDLSLAPYRQRVGQLFQKEHLPVGPLPLMLDMDAEQDHSGISDEMTIERKVGRKFQTQGWK